MFCHNCGKKNNDGVNFCAGCGKPLNEGHANMQQNYTPTDNVDAWGGFAMFFLCIISFAIPLAGWIVGYINKKHPARSGQAGTLITIAWISFIIDLIIVLGD